MVCTAGRGGTHSRGKRYNKTQNGRTRSTRANAEQARPGRGPGTSFRIALSCWIQCKTKYAVNI